MDKDGNKTKAGAHPVEGEEGSDPLPASDTAPPAAAATDEDTAEAVSEPIPAISDGQASFY